MSIFTIFSPDDVTGVRSTEVTTGLWSPNETGSLSAVYSSSVQIGISGEYYYDLYNLPTGNSEAEVQFSVAYGHRLGSGSPSLAVKNDSTLPTQVIYSQYRNILLENGAVFSFDGVDSDHIYVININRSRMKQALDAGNWELGLKGTKGQFTFIDDSGAANEVIGNIIASSVYNIVSGSIVTGQAADTTVYGLAFPDYGALVLYPNAISSSVGLVAATGAGMRTSTTSPFAPWTGSGINDYQYQHEGLVRAISASMASGYPFKARSVEKVASQNYFVRLKNGEYNYTNNPSYYTTAEDGSKVILDVFKDKPLTYASTIGLYNDANELVAVAKLSRPIQKNEDREALIRVRLDY
jgi:hypothetical protein